MSRCFACNDPLPIQASECYDKNSDRYYCPHCWDKSVHVPEVKTEDGDADTETLDEESLRKAVEDFDISSQSVCTFQGTHTHLIPHGDNKPYETWSIYNEHESAF